MLYCYQILYVREISEQEIMPVLQIYANLFDLKFTHLEKIYILTFHGSYVTEILAAFFPNSFSTYTVMCISFISYVYLQLICFHGTCGYDK